MDARQEAIVGFEQGGGPTLTQGDGFGDAVYGG